MTVVKWEMLGCKMLMMVVEWEPVEWGDVGDRSVVKDCRVGDGRKTTRMTTLRWEREG